MPWEEWRDVGPETVGLASDISRGAHLSSRRPRIESHSEPETTVKEGSTLQSPSSSSSFLLSLSFLLFSRPPTFIAIFLSFFRPDLAPFSLFSLFSLSFFLFFRSRLSRPSTVSIPGQRKRVFSALQPRPANNRERVTPCSAYHTHYPPIFFFFCPVEFIAGKCRVRQGHPTNCFLERVVVI